MGWQRGIGSSSHCFPFSIILIGRIEDRKGDGMAYVETGFSSSKDEEGSGDDEDKEGGGERFPTSLRLQWMSAQSCCVIYSAINARGMT